MVTCVLPGQTQCKAGGSGKTPEHSTAQAEDPCQVLPWELPQPFSRAFDLQLTHSQHQGGGSAAAGKAIQTLAGQRNAPSVL